MTDPLPEIEVVRSIAELRHRMRYWRSAGLRVGLVPTMGSLHDGHLSLVHAMAEEAERVVVTIFVNPTQFAAHEDLDRYPRNEAADLARLATVPCDLVYAPSVAEMYPEGFATRVRVTGLTDGLCGASRPHFFEGVATVVAKLLIQANPDFAIFGEKDYQQLLTIRRMARDLDLRATILGAPIVREPDGLAMSSRNAYLGPDERRRAPVLHATLLEVAANWHAGRPPAVAVAEGIARLEREGLRVDYLEMRDAVSLAPLAADAARGSARILAAVNLGATRLIDNVPA
ncbi:MAG: pantoate--beta-alanine ligase [Rhizobiales bacterium]|nr:pantoate--beta-alanine ligase [Hyphomicrobiales bacterium]